MRHKSSSGYSKQRVQEIESDDDDDHADGAAQQKQQQHS